MAILSKEERETIRKRAEAGYRGGIQPIMRLTAARGDVSALLSAIDALEARLAEAERLLSPFASCADRIDGLRQITDEVGLWTPNSGTDESAPRITAGHVRAARAFLAAQETK